MSVIIVNVGGQSSLCTTRLTLRKAWISLPVKVKTRIGKEEHRGGDDDNRTGGSQSAVEVTDIMTVLVEAMSVQLSNCLSSGLVTVAAWDAILGLSTTLLTDLSLALVVLPFHLSFSDDENASVMGLEVPPPPEDFRKSRSIYTVVVLFLFILILDRH